VQVQIDDQIVLFLSFAEEVLLKLLCRVRVLEDICSQRSEGDAMKLE
jgi:hypothetical protein